MQAGTRAWRAAGGKAARSGRALTYELCFHGDVLSDKSILPHRS